MQMIDIGLNLFCRQWKQPESILEEAARHGIYCILTGSDMQENRMIRDFVRNHEAVGTAGIHPHNADSAAEADFEEMREMLLKEDRLVAVGECGLDYDRMFSTRDNQLACLKKHIALAEKIGKPMFLHERDASEDLMAVFREHPDICSRAVVHCFTGDRKTLQQYLDMGFMISITGWICDDRRAGDLRDAVPILPLDRVMVETDAPYLTPRNVKGLDRVNVPWNLPYVLRDLARYMGVPEETLREAALRNTIRFFGLSEAEKCLH